MWTLVWARVEHFCYKLDRVKACCILCYFLQQKVCSIVFSNVDTVALIIGILVLPTLIDTYCFIVYKAKDAKVSSKNQHRLSVTVCSL